MSTEAVGFVTFRDVTERPSTVNDESDDLPLKLAEIVAEPAATPVTRPPETVALLGLEDVHWAWVVTSFCV